MMPVWLVMHHALNAQEVQIIARNAPQLMDELSQVTNVFAPIQINKMLLTELVQLVVQNVNHVSDFPQIASHVLREVAKSIQKKVTASAQQDSLKILQTFALPVISNVKNAVPALTVQFAEGIA